MFNVATVASAFSSDYRAKTAASDLKYGDNVAHGLASAHARCMRQLVLVVVLAAVAIGCASPVAATVGDQPQGLSPVAVCAPDFTEEERAASESLWGVEFTCDRPGIYVTVADLGEEFVGYCYADGKVVVSPRAWGSGQEPDLVLAHEIGHALWNDHNDGHPCDIMANDGWDVECIRGLL